MRLLKFRAWDKKYKRMIQNSGFWINPVNGKCFWLNLPEMVEAEDLIPMQYVDLLDKNGKEIYEGDIVFSPAFQKKMPVEFYKGQFCVHDSDGLYTLMVYSNLEVVGNIYENRNP